MTGLFGPLVRIGVVEIGQPEAMAKFRSEHADGTANVGHNTRLWCHDNAVERRGPSTRERHGEGVTVQRPADRPDVTAARRHLGATLNGVNSALRSHTTHIRHMNYVT